MVPDESGLSTREPGPAVSDTGCMLDDFTYAVLEDSLLVRGSSSGATLPSILRESEWELLRMPLSDLAVTCRLRLISDEEAEQLLARNSCSLSPALLEALGESGRGRLPSLTDSVAALDLMVGAPA
jgi:hypothetical protein